MILGSRFRRCGVALGVKGPVGVAHVDLCLQVFVLPTAQQPAGAAALGFAARLDNGGPGSVVAPALTAVAQDRFHRWPPQSTEPESSRCACCVRISS